ncbi:HNH endonuclease [Escherichia coli]|uniref:HNH endonuclease n=1 Tax=Escherichia coli TaxID=562 RepID=UPI0038B3957B
MSAFRQDPPPDEIRDLVIYRDGALYWNPERPERARRKPADQPIGTPDNHGYLRCSITVDGERRNYKVHRLIYWLEKHEWPEQVDHKNIQRLDNRIENLRAATCGENMLNMGASKTSKTGYRGVVECKNGTYGAFFQIGAKHKVFTGYKTKEAAALARDVLVHLFHGEFGSYGISKNAALKVGGVTI